MTSQKTIKTLEQEIAFLKITINHMATENQDLKQKIEDLKVTYQSNKDLLKEYLSQISNKDSTVQKLNNTIEQLKTRLKNLDPPSGKKGNNIITSNYEMFVSEDLNETQRNINKRNCITTRQRTKNNLNKNSSTSKLANLKEMSEVKFRKYTDDHGRIIKELKELKESLIGLINDTTNNKDNNNEEIETTYTSCKNINEILVNNNDNTVILFVDNDNQIWELTEEKNITEDDILKLKDNLINISQNDEIDVNQNSENKGDNKNEINLDNMSVEISQCSSLSEDNNSNLNDSNINIRHDINSSS